LTLNGRKRNLRRKDFLDYFAVTILKLPSTVINDKLSLLEKAQSAWFDLIKVSFLNDELKDKYQTLMENRLKTLIE
jgi:serine/threonine-protein kinase HipA